MQEKKTQEMVTEQVGGETFTASRSLEWVSIGDCVVDNTYQRDLCEKWVDKLIAAWDAKKCEPIKAVQRDDGYYYVFDGNHRLEAMRRKKYTAVPCWVYKGLSYNDEVGLFVSQATAAKPLRPFDTYKANLQINDPIDTLIKSVLDKYSFVASSYGTVSSFRCLTDARKTIRRDGYDMLDSIFDVYERSGWRETSGKEGFKAFHFRIIKQLLTDNLDHKEEVIATLKNKYPSVMVFRATAYTTCKENAAGESQACRMYVDKVKRAYFKNKKREKILVR